MELGIIGTDRQDMACVIVANPLEERGYILRGAHRKVKTILGIKNRAGPEVDGLVCAKEPRSRLLDLGLPKPGVCRTCNRVRLGRWGGLPTC